MSEIAIRANAQPQPNSTITAECTATTFVLQEAPKGGRGVHAGSMMRRVLIAALVTFAGVRSAAAQAVRCSRDRPRRRRTRQLPSPPRKMWRGRSTPAPPSNRRGARQAGCDATPGATAATASARSDGAGR